ncbi:uncharacterized protein TM35_000131720 [Trypanosoma theileri]|uniref:Co-chaperone DjlA N-terminal domain-containing protein n=1 Tax=Trypanosoma theileri TaxID=67003 RepID=A0A1X0NXA2_9TRYP|nr:uncharacterized protein TM35_000131720 [Trypanosoma theileri]ORC89168.1 hypothetical protein TM35_000131720 [Trypanosoma theileri]
MLRLTFRSYSCYAPAVGCAFLLDTLYGSKYSPHIGMCNMPYVYIKTVLFCVSGRERRELRELERNYVHGLIECLLPSNSLQDEQTKLELMQFVGAMPSRTSGVSAATPTATTVSDMHRRNEAIAAFQSLSTTTTTSSSLGSTGPVRSGSSNTSSSNSNNTSNSGGSSGNSGSPQVLENIASLLSGALLPAALARVLLYDAVCVCVADGEYDDGERERVSQVAAKLGIPHHVREAIEKVAVQQQQLSIRKRHLLLGNDTPPLR